MERNETVAAGGHMGLKRGLFFPKMGEIIACMYADGNDPGERENLI